MYLSHCILIRSPPLPVMETPFEYKPVDFQTANKLFIELGIQIQHQTVVDENCIEISGFYEDVLYTCVVQPVDILENINIGYTRRNYTIRLVPIKEFQSENKKTLNIYLNCFSIHFRNISKN